MRLGLEFFKVEIRKAEDIVPAVESIKGRADALYVCTDPLVTMDQVRINTLAIKQGCRRSMRFGNMSTPAR